MPSRAIQFLSHARARSQCVRAGAERGRAYTADAGARTFADLQDIGGSSLERSTKDFLDGGVRRGKDVFKALALGAKAVFVGRPALWGLSLGGEAGVARMLEILREELTTVIKAPQEPP